MHSGISTPEDIRKNNFDPDEFRAKRIDVDWLIDNQKKVNKIFIAKSCSISDKLPKREKSMFRQLLNTSYSFNSTALFREN